jgi:hypothetical protein
MTDKFIKKIDEIQKTIIDGTKKFLMWTKTKT